MFQSFSASTSPTEGPPRLAALRAAMSRAGLAGFIIPRADAHQGEWVAPRDERLAWLTGFTGSAGFCIVTAAEAGVFIDGRYTVQVKGQVDTAHFTPVAWPATKPAGWLAAALPEGGKVGFDPWLSTPKWIGEVEEGLKGRSITLEASANLIDRIWADQPAPPKGAVIPYPIEFAGVSSADKRAELGGILARAGETAAVITLPDSLAWLFNIRGADISRTPVAHGFAILRADATAQLFLDPAKQGDGLATHLGDGVTLAAPEDFGPALDLLNGPVRIDPASAPVWVSSRLRAANVAISAGDDPAILPKARKNKVEIAGTAEAHLRDGAAMAEFLCWLEAQTPGPDVTEIALVRKLEACRRSDNALRDISFETICGAGPHGALPHYRVSHVSDRQIETGDLIVVDSGGQYLDGTTDITRTVVMGMPSAEARRAFTLVLKGVIAISRLRWPVGLAGRDLDPFARFALWQAGLDFDHGTGHGVGHYLGVHEGPQRLSRISDVALEAGMILSNEPGYYREGAFGIRTENLVVVEEAPVIKGADARAMLVFRTLTFAPMDRRLIMPRLLTHEERAWLNAYHAAVLERIGPRVSKPTRDWLKSACAKL